ncbi:MAG: hypothetical protein JKZ03_07575 [Flavobacteriaceae bacterium]|nr:hypothetical protein [Flavobacteriaceae bacterium]
MEPIKFEEEIQKKFRQRELQPSQESWSRLVDKLDAKDEENKTNKLFWILIAASVVGVLFMASQFLNFEKPLEQSPLIVNEESPKALDSNSETVAPLVNNINKAVKEGTNKFKSSINESQSLAVSREEIKISEDVVAVSSESLQLNAEQPKAFFSNNDSLFEMNRALANSEINRSFNTKVDMVISQLLNRFKDRDTVTINEVDALLAKAQMEIRKQRFIDSTSVKVDAMALLDEVEWEFELHKPFRNRFLKALGEGVVILKTTIIVPNN